jgi:tight adherence protein B
MTHVLTELTLLKWTALALVTGACLALAAFCARTETLWGAETTLRLVRRLDARLRRLFLPPRAATIVTTQALATLACGALVIVTRRPLIAAALPIIALTPHVYLTRLEKQRLQRIEAKVDAFTVALANALRATPNVARALATVARTLSSPLNQELELTLRELRVGSTLDQALTDLSARASSTTLDTTVSALLIGRRVGGDVPAILDETGASVREITRLQSVLRAKTADARVQTFVLAAFPVGVVVVFEFLSPGYFAPLVESAFGSLVAVAALGLWLAALVLCRSILRVEL